MSSPGHNPPPPTSDHDDLDAQVASQIMAALPTLLDTVGKEMGFQLLMKTPNGELIPDDRIGVKSVIYPPESFDGKTLTALSVDSLPKDLRSQGTSGRVVDESVEGFAGGRQQDAKTSPGNKENIARNGVWTSLGSAVKALLWELRARTLSRLGNDSESIFHLFGVVEDLNCAVNFRSRAVALTSNQSTHKAHRLIKLGAVYLRRSQCLGELLDLDNAIDCLSQAVQLMPEGHPNMSGSLMNLGSAYQFRFDVLNRISDIHEAIACRSCVLQLISEAHADYASLLEGLGRSHLCRFLRLDDLSDIDRAVACQTLAVERTSNGHIDRPKYLNSLGITYRRRFERFGRLSDVMNAVACQTQAVYLTPDGCSDKPCWLFNLGNSYQTRFLRLGDLSDAEKAITYQNQALELTPNDSLLRFSRLSGLGTTYIRRFERLGDLPDINKAVDLLSQAVWLAPGSDTYALNNLGTAYMCRFEHFGNRSDISSAVHFLSLAVKHAPDGLPEKSGWLGNLGDSYARRFQSFGNIADIDQAITHQIQAVEMTPDGHTSKPRLFHNLAASFMCRFERLGTIPDVHKAVGCQIKAVKLTPDGHALKPSFLNGLGNSYRVQFSCLGHQSLIDKAIAFHSQAVQLTPDSHASKPLRLNNLGTSYQCRFEKFGNASDINNAIKCTIQAVELTPDDHADKPSRLRNLGKAYGSRFERLGDLADVDQAILYQHQAMELMEDCKADLPCLFIDLGSLYIRRFALKGMLSDAKDAHAAYKIAAQAVVTDPKLQLRSAYGWSKCCILLGISPKSAYQRIMELVSQRVWLGLTLAERYHVVAEVVDVARDSAAWAISAQEYDLAVEWIEEARSIVWTQILRLRTPFDDLYASNPALAQRLKDIALQLERAGSRDGPKDLLTSSPLDLEKDPQNHRRLAIEWEQLLEHAREIPGFHNFLFPRKANELKLAAANGPIIMININQARCDALIIRSHAHAVAHVPLANFSLEKAAEARVQLESLVGHRADRAGGFKRSRTLPKPEDMFKPMLATLWLDVVEPVLDFLGYTQEQPFDELPHITWCTTGALAFLPLHAAGLYDGEQRSAFDLVVSSYAPTLSALLDLGPPTPHSASGLLAVGQENTKGLSRLPYTIRELSEIRACTQGIPYLQLDGKNATANAVLAAMEEYSWVHLACHAKQDPSIPTHSQFCLHDGGLTLETITKRSFKNKGLAFLSACQTATGDSKVPDEALHLAAGMLMAGYPSVIATMWSISDADGPEVARTVYSELIKDGKLDYKGAARALHKAVGGLREKVGRNSFMRWVPFIHIGV